MSEPLRGSTEPRLWTPPKRELSPATSLGFDLADFSAAFGMPLMPYQSWLAAHMLELDGASESELFRFRTSLVLVARQCGKTTYAKVLTAFLMVTGRAKEVLGTAQNLQISKELWQATVEFMHSDPELRREVLRVRYANGEQELTLKNGARYRLAATRANAGRGLSIDLLIMDELRTHEDWSAWASLAKTTNARPNPMTLCLSNAGGDSSTVLNTLRENALSSQDGRLFIAEWSAPDGCALDDRSAWAQAIPALGYTLPEAAVEAALSTDPAAVFRTEMLCQRVASLDAAFALDAWKSSEDRSRSIARGLMETDDEFAVRRDSMTIFAGLDVSLDGDHTTLVLGVQESGRIRLEVAAAWDDTRSARSELPKILESVRPSALVWFPSGPAAVLAADLERAKAMPRGTRLVELTGNDVTAACMGYADQVVAGLILHPGDDLLNAQLANTVRRRSINGWTFSRSSASHVDSVYAAAAVVYQATKHGESRAQRWAGKVI